MKNENDSLLIEILSKTNWRHKIKLSNDIYTPGYCAENEWELCQLPKSLKGLSFLDVASNDGMYSYIAEKKGATKVVGVDIYGNDEILHMTDSWDISKPKLIKEYFNLSADFHSLSVMHLSELKQKFDYVLCSNLLAWLTDPFAALKSMSDVTNKVLHLREDISTIKGKPALELVHKGDGSCYYNPNKEYFIEVLTQLGFKKIEFSLINERNLLIERLSKQCLVNFELGTPIYLNPFTMQEVSKTESTQLHICLFIYKDYYFIERLGWVKKENIKTQQPFVLGRRYPYLTAFNKIMKNKLNLEKNYVIKATR